MKNVLMAVVLVTILAAVAAAPSPPPVDLSGLWGDSDNRDEVLITQTGNSVVGTYKEKKCDCRDVSGTIILWKPTFRVTLAGNKLTGKGNACYWGKGSKMGVGIKEDKVELTIANKGDALIGTQYGFNGEVLEHFTLLRRCSYSGLPWVKRFPESKSTDDLAEPFRTGAKHFIAAIEAAGGHVGAITTNRPLERSYLMHWAWLIAHGANPKTAPISDLLKICWMHKDANGNDDLQGSKAAAAQMIGEKGYGMDHDAYWDEEFIKASQHNLSTGIDMTITWTGTIVIKDGNGNDVSLTADPDGDNSGNTDLHQVGASYGVNKLLTDRPHWSATGH